MSTIATSSIAQLWQQKQVTCKPQKEQHNSIPSHRYCGKDTIAEIQTFITDKRNKFMIYASYMVIVTHLEISIALIY